MHRDIELNHWHDDHNRIELWNQCDSHPYHIFVVFVNNTKIPYNLITFLQLVGYWFYLPYFIIILTLCLIEIYVCIYIYIYIFFYHIEFFPLNHICIFAIQKCAMLSKVWLVITIIIYY